MRNTRACTILAASSIVAGSVILTPVSDVRHSDYVLVDSALIIDPIVN
jgi:hypothetical protein